MSWPFQSRTTAATAPNPWSTREKAGIAISLMLLFLFGLNLENRTALRRVPMTDLGVFAFAAESVKEGTNLYAITDWHGWHYQYPPLMAILFRPLAHPLPGGPPQLAPDIARTELNTPWGYSIGSRQNHFGLHRVNLRFFAIVAVWYWLSVFFVCFSSHALACSLEGATLTQQGPRDHQKRLRWWLLRLLPILICIGSIGTELSRGQVDVVMLAAICLAIYLASRGYEKSAGISLSFPVMVKLFPPYLILYPFWRGKWKMAAGVVGGLVLGLVLIPLLTFGPRKTVELYHNWIEVLAKPALGKGTDQSRLRELTGLTSTDNQSLLAFFHNWLHHGQERRDRPATASSATRIVAHLIGLLLLAAAFAMAGFRKIDSTRQMLLIIGSLVAISLVASPIVHNFYYLLMLPLVAVLVERSLHTTASGKPLKLPVPVLVFMVIDLLARLPALGPKLRDWGFPLLSILWLIAAALVNLRNSRNNPAEAETSSEESSNA